MQHVIKLLIPAHNATGTTGPILAMQKAADFGTSYAWDLTVVAGMTKLGGVQLIVGGYIAVGHLTDTNAGFVITANLEDVDGTVMTPDVYELPAGAIMRDAIEAAGGLTAERLHDGLRFRFYLLVELLFALDNLFRPTSSTLDLNLGDTGVVQMLFQVST